MQSDSECESLSHHMIPAKPGLVWTWLGLHAHGYSVYNLSSYISYHVVIVQTPLRQIQSASKDKAKECFDIVSVFTDIDLATSSGLWQSRGSGLCKSFRLTCHIVNDMTAGDYSLLYLGLWVKGLF